MRAASKHAKNSASPSSMFKRIEKRLQKLEQEERLGIDDEMRDALGLDDTDSSESDLELSDSNADVFQDGGEVDDSEDEDMDEAWGGIEGDGLDEEEGSEEDEEESPLPVAFQIFTAKQALEEPIYTHPTQRNAHLCAICPGKTFISPQSISQHPTSKAHERRSKNIAKLAALPENVDSSLGDLLGQMDGRPRPGSSQPKEGEAMSKRAEKKRKTVEMRKAGREKQKAKAKARKEREKQKQEEERDAHSDEDVPKKGDPVTQTVPSAKKGKRKDKKAKVEPSQPMQANQGRPAKDAGKTTQLTPVKPEELKKEKKRKEKDSTVPEEPLAKKKRKTGALPSEEEEIVQQIKDIAKSATMRARKAMSKAKQSHNDDDKHKGKKKKTG